MPPLTVYKSESLHRTCTKGGPQGAVYNFSESGAMHKTIFEQWFSNTFIDFVKHHEKPVILALNGLNFVPTFKTLNTAMENEIILFCLPLAFQPEYLPRPTPRCILK